MIEKRSNLKAIWEKIEAIKSREEAARAAITSVIGNVSGKIKDGIDRFDDFLDGNFQDGMTFLGKEYIEQNMIDYLSALPEQMKKDNRSWLASMSNEEIFVETLSVCPKLLNEVFDEEKANGYEGLPVSFNKLLKVQNSIPAMKWLSRGEFIINMTLAHDIKSLDLDKVTKIISQSQRNIDIILKNAENFDNLHEVFDKHPSLIKVLDQNLLMDNVVGKKIIESINKASETNQKVKDFAEFYMSFFLDNEGKVLESKSKSDTLLETLDPMEEKKKNALSNIKSIAGKREGTINNPHIKTRLNR